MESGTRLGPYEILEQLGAGGMGEVYRARDTRLDRDVAIKVLPEHFANDGERLARFEREAKLLAQLNHPNIATIHGFEESGGVHFIAMELVEGESLAQRITSFGPIAADDALAIARQIAMALEGAHGAGVVHRDLKPANVVVTPEGTAKVLDFGLAKASAASGSSSGPSPDMTQSPTLLAATGTGVIMGTAGYMSPEQAKGKALDKRSDIWSFGVVLYEMLTGSSPFRGEDVSETLAAILRDEPDWAAVPTVHPAILRLLRRALAKDPKARLHDIADARLEIEEALADPDDHHGAAADSTTGGSTWRRLLPWAIAAAAVLTATLSFFNSPGTSTASIGPTMRFAVAAADGTQVTTHPAISPDGSVIAFAAGPVGGTGSQLYLRRIGEDEPVALPGTDRAVKPFFSPDGQWIGFSTEDALMKIAITGGAAVLIADTPAGYGATWTDDDRIVFVPRYGASLMQVPAGGGEPAIVAALAEERGEEGFLWPWALPGSDTVLATLANGGLRSMDDALIVAISLQTGEQTILFPGGSGARFVGTGHIIYARSGTLRAVGFDPETLEVQQPSVLVLEGLATERTGGSALFAVAGNGTLLYVAGGPDPDGALVWADRQGKVTTAVDARESFYSARISPDGRRAAVVRGSASHELWVYDLARGTAIPIEQHADTHTPVWAPDGLRVFYSRREGGKDSVFVRSADGRGAEKRLVEGGRPTSITPDGATLVVTRVIDGFGSIWQLPLVGKEAPARVHESRAREGEARLSPDGRWLAYTSSETGRSELYVERYPGGERRWQVSTAGATSPRWSGDSSELFFTVQNRLLVAVAMVPRQDPPFQAPVELFESPVLLRGRGGRGDAAPSGERFLMVERPLPPPATDLQVVLNWFGELQQRAPTGRQ